jgi:hypothetical protein
MPMKDDRIASIVTGRLARSTGIRNSNISDESQRVLDYYNGALPKPSSVGSSKYISHDVFEGVEMMTAQLTETFTGALQPVRFPPRNSQDVQEAAIATAVTNFVVNVQNDGFGIIQSVVQDGLMRRMGVVKAWWEKSEEEEEFTFEDTSFDEMNAYAARNPKADLTHLDVDDQTGAINNATFNHKTDTSQVRIMALPGEEFGISGAARSLQDADLTYHRQLKTPSELEAMGFDAAVVETLATGREWLLDSEQFARAGDVDSNLAQYEDDEQKAGRKIELFECYTKLDIDEDGLKAGAKSNRRLWKIMLAGGKVLDKEQVKRIPFIEWTPLPRAHTVWGSSFADKLVATQNARTVLRRGVIDHTVRTVNPRYEVQRGGLPNPTELLENKIGGIVNVRKIGESVAPLVQPPLNPFVFQTTAAIDDDKEELTGISKLSQGLNKDAISSQNSQGMVEQLISMSQVRQKVIARRFAEFLKKVYLEAYRLVRENASQQFIVAIAGEYAPADPSSLAIREHLDVDFSLGYGEKDREGQKLQTLFAALNGISKDDPALAQAFDAPRKYGMLKRILDANGFKDTDSFIGDPSKMKPPPPNPMQQLQVQKAQADVQVATSQAQATAAKIQREEQRDAMQHQIEMTKLQATFQKEQAMLQLDIRKQAHKEVMDAAEIRLATQEIEAGKAQAIIAPKS